MTYEVSNVVSAAIPADLRIVNIYFDVSADRIPLITEVPGPTKYAARFKSGTYTGDGTTGQAVVGIGFGPEWLKIWEIFAAAATGITGPWEKTNNGPTTTFCFCHMPTDGEIDVVDDAIIALGADGFTVDDAGSDADPNEDTEVYHFVCARQ